ncbi:uncharacterized protein DNG_01213 [Cephalotrichum gorgonifer]|uniref:Peptidase M20 dimerisation domain-containing protein n=1 Tax=Cephalotrichum gorgonifer TaxID=2041049 RepID=A0AAE8MQ39_9PEZI|nr:uncharacterized protein DNG_01213 [Cephalotrichum gorgonifer]
MAEKTEVEHVAQQKEHDIAAGSMAEELSAAEDKRLLRRIDMCLLPIMAISYMFQFLDKSALGFTAIMGLRQDLKLSGGDFSWASGVYYIGYLVASYPAGMIMVRYPVAKTIAAAVVLWGAVLMLTAVTSNSGGLLAIRFLLGVCESPIGPGLTVCVAMWYKRSEQPLRHAAWFMGNSVAGIIGGLIAYGIGHVDSIPPWKAVFLIFGAATVAWSAGVYFLLPDVPMTARFLNGEDRVKAVLRVKENLTGIKNNTFEWKQCREALLDGKAWLIALIHLCANIPNGGVHSFSSIVIEEGLGFDTLPTLLLTSASYLAQLAIVLFATGGSTYLRNTRTYFMIWNLALSIAGSVMVRQVSAEHKWVRYAGYCLVLGFTGNFPLVMAMVSGNFGGFTKKMTVNSMVFIAYCAGNIVGPQLFFAHEAPEYRSGFLSMIRPEYLQRYIKRPSSSSAPSGTMSESFPVDIEKASELITGRIGQLSDDLHTKVNKVLHANPELCYQEFIAHETLTSYLENLGFSVQRGTYGLETSFEAAFGEGGRQVVFCCEYDALPDIGHACGHNLIATSSIAAFIGAAHAMSELQIPGRLRILGTPAEEGGGGKALLIENGAFTPAEDIAAAIMAHPMAEHSLSTADRKCSGVAGLTLIASHKFRAEFWGESAHAAAEPWSGTNALDAAVAAYNNAAVLRQQISPDERIHAIIKEGGVVTNIIPAYTCMDWGVRAPTFKRSEKLFEKVKKCIEAGALATGCTHKLTMSPTYYNLRANETLCKVYIADMAKVGEDVLLYPPTPQTASTDMGNVSHIVPSFHGVFCIPTEPGVAIHSPQFASSAATDEAHTAAIKCAKGMALLALRVLTDGNVADGARKDFEIVD